MRRTQELWNDCFQNFLRSSFSNFESSQARSCLLAAELQAYRALLAIKFFQRFEQPMRLSCLRQRLLGRSHLSKAVTTAPRSKRLSALRTRSVAKAMQIDGHLHVWARPDQAGTYPFKVRGQRCTNGPTLYRQLRPSGVHYRIS